MVYIISYIFTYQFAVVIQALLIQREINHPEKIKFVNVRVELM